MTVSSEQLVTISDPQQMHSFGVRLGAQLQSGDLVILSGELGAGKTTLTRGIGEGLGVRGPVTSPTFVLARTHPSIIGGAPLVHVDAYRLASALELDDLDIDFERSVVVAEWALGMLDDVSDSRLEIAIERPTGGAVSPSNSGQPQIEADGPIADADEEPVEPRSVVITLIGPRWANTKFADD
jgi:tRNA threonylcarbamoyladenosine biosynthesis protein TsaE